MYSEFLTRRYKQTALKIQRLTRVYESLRSEYPESKSTIPHGTYNRLADNINEAVHLINLELNNLLNHQATQSDRIREALDQERK